MHLKTLLDWTGSQVKDVLDLAGEIKATPGKFQEAFHRKTLILLLEKTSTRTRASFEAGATRMGGHAMILDARGTQLGKGASLKEEAQCLVRYGDVMAARVYNHESIRTLADISNIPIINALCDLYHPCQALADMMVLREKLGDLEGRKLCYVGDGNNVCNSLIIAASRLGLKISVATPPGYEPLRAAVDTGNEAGVLSLHTDPGEAAEEADAVYTDTWISMGQEEEASKRRKIFAPYQVTTKLLGKAYFLHCLPLYRGEEVAEDVPDLERSIIFDQAENRMHVQNAVILKCLETQ
ncbi:MAG: ornithine carbamoyltransferase [Planctomycetota bacterium]|jgi:ornithine carbamoyltransferase